MLKAEYARHFSTEAGHWYFRGKRAVLESVIRAERVGGRILDVGCGTGGNLPLLRRFGRVHAADLSPEALGGSRRRGPTPLCRANVMGGLPYRTASFDALFAVDVVEHLDDDVGAVKEMVRVLRPGGTAVITAPAYRWLWTDHDEAACHRRRYRRGGLARVLTEAGLAVRRATYFNSILFPLAAVTRLWRRCVSRPAGAPRTDLFVEIPRALNEVLVRIFSLERHVLGRAGFPFGLTVLCVATRPAATVKFVPAVRRVAA